MRRDKPRSPRPAASVYPRLIRKTDHMEVRLMRGGRTIQRIGSVGIPLALDALRHGEDVVADLLDEARRALERRQPARRPAARSPETTRGAA